MAKKADYYFSFVLLAIGMVCIIASALLFNMKYSIFFTQLQLSLLFTLSIILAVCCISAGSFILGRQTKEKEVEINENEEQEQCGTQIVQRLAS